MKPRLWVYMNEHSKWTMMNDSSNTTRQKVIAPWNIQTQWIETQEKKIEKE